MRTRQAHSPATRRPTWKACVGISNNLKDMVSRVASEAGDVSSSVASQVGDAASGFAETGASMASAAKEQAKTFASELEIWGGAIRSVRWRPLSWSAF